MIVFWLILCVHCSIFDARDKATLYVYFTHRVIAVGVTNAVDLDELGLIASTSNDIFTVANFTGLDAIIDSLVTSFCPGKKDIIQKKIR